MNWDIEYTEAFGHWFRQHVTDDAQQHIVAAVSTLEEFGPPKDQPRHSHGTSSPCNPLRILRIQHRNAPYRVFYGVHASTVRMILIAGDSTPDHWWYPNHTMNGASSDTLSSASPARSWTEDTKGTPFHDLIAEILTPEQYQKTETIARRMIAQRPSHQLQQARLSTWRTLEQHMIVAPLEVSRLEKQTDLYISFFREYLETFGGTLDIVARFPRGAVRIDQFEMTTA